MQLLHGGLTPALPQTGSPPGVDVCPVQGGQWVEKLQVFAFAGKLHDELGIPGRG